MEVSAERQMGLWQKVPEVHCDKWGGAGKENVLRIKSQVPSGPHKLENRESF